MVTKYVRAAVFAAVITTAAVGCGDDDDAATPTTAAQGAEDDATTESTTGGASELTGDPVVIGYVNQEEGSTSTFPDQREASQAAVELINEQGGISGRPLELRTCITDGSPESSQACANELVQAGVAVVQAGTDFGDPASIPVLTAARIPYVPTLPFQAEHFASEGVFTFFGGAIAQTAAEVQTAVDADAEKVAMLVMNIPPAIQAAEQLVKAPLEAQGVEVTIVPFESNTADFTPSLTAVMQEDPDQIIVFTSGPPCGQVMQAAGALGIDVTMQYPSDCLTTEHLAAGGAGAEGALFMMETLLPAVHQDDPDVQMYLDAMERFAGTSADELTNSHQVAFIATYNLGTLLASIEGDITPASVTEALASAVDVESPMTQPYSCDGSAIPGFSSICGAGVRVVQRSGDELVEVADEWLTPAAA